MATRTATQMKVRVGKRRSENRELLTPEWSGFCRRGSMMKRCDVAFAPHRCIRVVGSFVLSEKGRSWQVSNQLEVPVRQRVRPGETVGF